MPSWYRTDTNLTGKDTYAYLTWIGSWYTWTSCRTKNAATSTVQHINQEIMRIQSSKRYTQCVLQEK